MVNWTYSCSITGHSPAGFSFGYDEGHPACIKIKQAIAEQIFFLANNGVSCFLSGMAQGADIWGAELVLDLKESRPDIQLACILPCETQANRWHEASRRRYFQILAKADYTHTISRHYTENCLLRHSRYLVDHSYFVLAVYNGNLKSSTAQTLHYAGEKKRAISIISPDSGRYTPFIL